MHRVIGVDPSLTSTAYSYTDAFGDVHTGRFIPKNMKGLERLHFMEESLHSVIRNAVAQQGGEPTLLTYEDYAMGARNKSRAFSMGELGGVLKLFAYRTGLDVLLVPPASLKIFMTGKGNADKDAMISAVATEYGFNVPQDDEADAFSLMKLGEAYASGRVRRGYKMVGINGCTLQQGLVVQ